MKSILQIFFSAAVVMAMGSGCATSGPGSKAAPVEDELEVIAFDPPMPATLRHGERLTLTVRYTLASADMANIYVRPYTGGRQSPGYIAHQADDHAQGRGEATGWFTFRGDVHVDEVRVTLVSEQPRKLLLTEKVAVDATWVAGDNP